MLVVEFECLLCGGAGVVVMLREVVDVDTVAVDHLCLKSVCLMRNHQTTLLIKLTKMP
jgi:hypothetical protein